MSSESTEPSSGRREEIPQHTVKLALAAPSRTLLPVPFLRDSELKREWDMVSTYLEVTEDAQEGIPCTQQQFPTRLPVLAAMLTRWVGAYQSEALTPG